MPPSVLRELIAFILIALLGLAVPNLAAAQDPQETPGELAVEGMERLLRAIELIIEMIPQYDAPEVLPNGDIIIRRKNPTEPRDDEEPEDEFDETGI